MFCEKCGTKISNEANFCSACGQRTTQVMETDSRSLTMPQDLKKAVSISAESTPFRYASTARRTIGGLIDMAIVFILSMIPTFLLLTASVPPEGLTCEQYAKFLGFSFGLIVSVAYEALLQSSRHQATLGQRFMKVIVTDLYGNRINLSKALGRTLMSCISSIIFKLGYAIQPFTSRKQTLHDMVAGTIVLDADKIIVENGKTPVGYAESKVQESGHEDRISGSRRVEAEAVGKSFIWNQKDMRYVIGILCLVVVIGLLVFGYVSNIGIWPVARDGRFIAYDNGTVLDTRTNLMWAAKDNGSDINWANARSYCENYRGGGYSDWRMPTQDELAGLYDAGKSRPAACDTSVPIHVATELIDITCELPWASETRGSHAANFWFRFGMRNWTHQSPDYRGTRALPVRFGK